MFYTPKRISRKGRQWYVGFRRQGVEEGMYGITRVGWCSLDACWEFGKDCSGGRGREGRENVGGGLSDEGQKSCYRKLSVRLLIKNDNAYCTEKKKRIITLE